jgi:hypothetical protein
MPAERASLQFPEESIGSAGRLSETLRLLVEPGWLLSYHC